MTSLREFSDELGRVVQAALPGVVSVYTGGCASAAGLAWADGRVVTVASRLRREEGLAVGTNGDRTDARLVGFDARSDLAVLRVDGALECAVRRPQGQPLALGEIVLALGRTSSPLARLGVIGRLGGEWRGPGGARFDRFIESDIAPAAGLAGGALIDAAGELIGINSVSLARGRLVTLPMECVDRIVEALTAHGRVRRARFGVSVQRVELPAGPAAELGHRAGVIVLAVQPRSPAEQAGVGLGDVLLTFGDVQLESADDLYGALDAATIDRDVPVALLRAGRVMTLKVVPSSTP